MLSAAKDCSPCKEKPKPAQVFKLGDVVQHIHSGEIFNIGIIAKGDYGDVFYGASLKYYMKGEHIREMMATGHSLKKFPAKAAAPKTKAKTKNKAKK